MIEPHLSDSEPVTIVAPRGQTVPAFFDSPHSGSNYPDDFDSDLDNVILRRMEDAFVDELFSAVPDFGATLIAARFPRSYVDPNRSDLDIDPSAFHEWRGPAQPSEKSRFGKGLIWTLVHGDERIYERKLSATEVQMRIKNYWQPYHHLIASTYDKLHAQFGCVYHVNCHSMRAKGNASDPDGEVKRSDFIISDHNGKSCSGEFRKLVVGNLSTAGFDVAINKPYKGAELTRRYSDPEIGRHSLQIEINRRLYMDETRVERSNAFKQLQNHMTNLAKTIADFAVN